MTQNRLVSIGLPVHNGEKYLARALDSLLAQDYRDFELIISDNASTDKTESICREYAARDGRIRYHRNHENIGALANFRRVLELAQGNFFMWSASDDQWLPGFISATLRELEQHSEAVVAMTAVQKIYEDRSESDIVRFFGRDDPNHMSHFRLAMALAAGKPYHLYIYGLYRSEFLRKTFRYFRSVAGGDRLFVCHAAMVAPFRYIDRVLHIRQISKELLQERYQSESLGRIWRDIYAKEKMVLAAGPYLMSSPLIPLHRKFLIPLVVVRLASLVTAFRLRWVAYGVRDYWRASRRASKT